MTTGIARQADKKIELDEHAAFMLYGAVLHQAARDAVRGNNEARDFLEDCAPLVAKRLAAGAALRRGRLRS